MNNIDRFAEVVTVALEMCVKKGTLTREQADRITDNLHRPEYVKPFLDLLGISEEDWKGMQNNE